MLNLLFVYGTLKRKGINNFVITELCNGRFIGEAQSDPFFTMIDLGLYPAVVIGGNTAIKGEVFEIDSIEAVDRLEGYPRHYDRKLVDTPFGSAWMYFQHRSISSKDNYDTVPSGEWKC